jgi:PAS domain S-box-containing protein
MLTPDYRELIYVSPAYEEVWGRSIEKIHENPADWLQAIHPEDRERVESNFYRRAEGAGWTEEYRIVRSDGTQRWIYDHGVPVKDETGAVVRLVGIAEDVTASRQAAEQLRQQREELAHVARLNTMGEMASSLAHELNQPLAAIATYTSSGLIGLQSGSLGADRWQELLQKVNTQAQRAGDIINRLKALVAKRAPHRSQVNVNDLVHDVAALMDSELRTKRVRLELQLEPVLPSAHADPVQIQQVLVNLLMNGIDAVSDQPVDGRRLQVRTSHRAGRGVLVLVSDAGPGMSSEHVEQVFEPFYTTKASGMGMGLSISRSIIEAHGGHLTVDAGPEQGATFRFDLPFE